MGKCQQGEISLFFPTADRAPERTDPDNESVSGSGQNDIGAFAAAAAGRPGKLEIESRRNEQTGKSGILHSKNQ